MEKDWLNKEWEIICVPVKLGKCEIFTIGLFISYRCHDFITINVYINELESSKSGEFLQYFLESVACL